MLFLRWLCWIVSGACDAISNNSRLSPSYWKKIAVILSKIHNEFYLTQYPASKLVQITFSLLYYCKKNGKSGAKSDNYNICDSDLFCLVFERLSLITSTFGHVGGKKKASWSLTPNFKSKTWFTFSLLQPRGEGWSPTYYVILLGLY